ncbi:MAG: efflux RND transporter periplasmic adaptor subunit [Sulfuricellaceae bacterium]
MIHHTFFSRRLALLVAALVCAAGIPLRHAVADNTKPAAAAKPALAVETVKPQARSLPHRLEANGNVAAWQEASLGAESGGLRLAEVRADVGDKVKRGQVLAVFANDTPLIEVAQARAALAEAEAAALEAAANAARARSVQASGALSAQQIGQYLSSDAGAKARVQSAQANLSMAELRLKHTQVLASDDGVISQRNPQATLGAVVAQGQELFRLIRKNRLEWRAEVTADELANIRIGQAVTVKAAGGASRQGKVRQVAPTVDAQTRNALVYVDLPAAKDGGAFKPGMFARGEFALGNRMGLTVPRQALVVRDGFNYVFLVGSDNRAHRTKVEVGGFDNETVEIVSGLDAQATLAAGGAGFLNEGDLVKVVQATPAAKTGN